MSAGEAENGENRYTLSAMDVKYLESVAPIRIQGATATPGNTSWMVSAISLNAADPVSDTRLGAAANVLASGAEDTSGPTTERT